MNSYHLFDDLKIREIVKVEEVIMNDDAVCEVRFRCRGVHDEDMPVDLIYYYDPETDEGIPYLLNLLEPGTLVRVIGKFDIYPDGLIMCQPEIEELTEEERWFAVESLNQHLWLHEVSNLKPGPAYQSPTGINLIDFQGGES